MVLRRDRDLAYSSAHGAGGVAHGCAEQLGKGDERHEPEPWVIADLRKDNRVCA
jgi:hypothetical protein